MVPGEADFVTWKSMLILALPPLPRTLPRLHVNAVVRLHVPCVAVMLACVLALGGNVKRMIGGVAVAALFVNVAFTVISSLGLISAGAFTFNATSTGR